MVKRNILMLSRYYVKLVQLQIEGHFYENIFFFTTGGIEINPEINDWIRLVEGNKISLEDMTCW